ncbi:MAG TPA: Ig-like domain-containing protein [Candidatus Limnocylindrales bacterium]|nr:Ig-like domain-containing protein [Candidatus Limnocylindrales bacterium]
MRLKILLRVLVIVVTIVYPLGTFAQVDVPVESVRLNVRSLTLQRAETEILTAAIAPTNATNKKLRWVSSDSQVVRIVATRGLSAEIKALSAGAATITVITDDGGKRAFCQVEVIVLVRSISLRPSEATLKSNEKLQLQATIDPADATEQRLTWESTNPAVAAVDQNGLVTAQLAGQARVIARSLENQSIVAHCSITVSGAVAAPEPKPEPETTPEPVPRSEPPPELATGQEVNYLYIVIGALVTLAIIVALFMFRGRQR